MTAPLSVRGPGIECRFAKSYPSASVTRRNVFSPDKPLSGELRRTAAKIAIPGCEHGMTAGIDTTNQTKTKPKSNTGTLRVSKWQTN